MTQPAPQPPKPAAQPPKPAPAGAKPKPAPKPPAASQPKPAPPPVQPQKQVAQPVQRCPLAAEKPCDVDKLEVQVQVFGEDAQVLKLATTKVRRLEAVTGIKKKSVLDLLGKYDLVIDAIAGYPSREDPHPRHRLKIQARSQEHGRKCPVSSHPVILVKPLTKAIELEPQGLAFRSTTMGPLDFLANPISVDFGVAGGNLSVLFTIIRSLWPTAEPKLVEIRADSCGKKARGAGVPPNRALVALVRIYRKDQIQIGIKLPPLGNYKHERAGKITGVRESKSASSYSAGFGYAKGESSSRSSGSGVLAEHEHSETRWRGGKGTSHSLSRSVEDGSVTRTFTEQSSKGPGRKIEEVDGQFRTEVLEELKKQGPIALVIRRNDRELEKELFGKDGRSLKEKLIDGLVKGIETIAEAIETFNKLPQLGWKLEFSISLFAGSIVLEWGPKYLPGPLAGGRYCPVGLIVMGKIAMDVIVLEAALSFGVEARALGTGIVAKVEGRALLKVPVETEIKMMAWQPQVEVTLKPEARFDGIAKGYASVAGYSLVDAQLTANVAITMDDGKLLVSADRGLYVTGTLRRQPIELKGYIKVPVWGLKRIHPPVVLCQGAILHKFK